jgi:site-specific recombinase XerD
MEQEQRRGEVRTQVVFVELPGIAASIPAYMDAQCRAGLRPGGIDAYRRSLRDVCRYYGDEATCAEITPASVASYHQSMIDRSLAASTMSKHLSALRSYCRWCIAAGMRADDPTLAVVYPRLPDYLPRPLSTDELAALFRVCNGKPGPTTHQNRRAVWGRNTLALCVFVYTGARLAEASGLRHRDVDYGRGTVTIREGKGGRTRVVPLHAALRRRLLALPADQRRADAPLICSARGGAIRPKSLGHMFERWLPEVGGPSITAHQLRHTYATLLREAGVDLDTIGELLGHRDPKTTRIYAKLPDRAKHTAVAELPDWDAPTTRQ